MESLTARIRVELASHQSASKIHAALQQVFGKVETRNNHHAAEEFPVSGPPLILEWTAELTSFLENLAKQRILDTALDAMSRHSDGRNTSFKISLQAAAAGRISFIIHDEYQLGGFATIDLEKDQIDEWLEEITWHTGRINVPRHVGDNRGMGRRGEFNERDLEI